MQLLAATLLKAPSGAMLWAATPPPGASVRLQLLHTMELERACWPFWLVLRTRPVVEGPDGWAHRTTPSRKARQGLTLPRRFKPIPRRHRWARAIRVCHGQWRNLQVSGWNGWFRQDSTERLSTWVLVSRKSQVKKVMHQRLFRYSWKWTSQDNHKLADDIGNKSFLRRTGQAFSEFRYRRLMQPSSDNFSKIVCPGFPASAGFRSGKWPKRLKLSLVYH